MNAKRAKAIRQALKVHGIDSSESGHLAIGESGSILYRSGTNINGTSQVSPFKYTPTIRLDPESGRAVYQAAKKLGLNPFAGSEQ